MNKNMGEVRVRVKIVNAGDEAQFRRGKLAKNKIRSTEVEAIIDTGATVSVLPRSVVDKLGLEIVREEVAGYANGSSEIVEVAETIIFEMLGRRCAEEPFVIGNEILIGQIPLERMDLLVDCKEQKLVPKHGDKPVFRI